MGLSRRLLGSSCVLAVDDDAADVVGRECRNVEQEYCRFIVVAVVVDMRLRAL